MKKNFAFVVFTLVLCFLAAELLCFVALQVITRRGFDRASIQKTLQKPAQTKASSSPAAFLLHPYLGYVSNPDIPNVVGSEMNRYGLFGPDPLSTQEGDFVVAVTGGSVAGLQASRYGSDLLAALQRIPALQNKKVVLANLALGGYKQPQQLMALQFFWALGASFDAVINLDGFNDVALPFADGASQGVVGHFPRNWRLLAGGPLDALPEATLLAILSTRQSIQSWRSFFAHPALRWSNLSLVLWDVISRKSKKKLQRLQTQALTQDTEPPFGLAGPKGFPRDFEGSLKEAIAIWERSSFQMHQACQARGIPYVHLLQPNQYLEGSKPLSDWEKKHAIREDQPYRKGALRGYPGLKEAGTRLRTRGVDFHDLTDVFSETKETLYVDDCCHFNQAGAKLLSQDIAKTLTARVR